MSEERYRESIRAAVQARARKKRGAVGFHLYEVCECCGVKRGTEMHEGRFRSQTRNRPPEERFGTEWCMWLCHDCHADLQEHRVDVYCENQILGLNGKYCIYRSPCRPPANFAWFTLTQVWRAITGSTA